MKPLSDAFAPSLKISEWVMLQAALREWVQTQYLELEHQRASLETMRQAIRSILRSDRGEGSD